MITADTLVPLDPRLRYVPYAVDAWCPLLRSAALPRSGRRSVRLLGASWVLFRGDDGVVRALEDRCPHRGVPLSLGCVEGNALRCAYHGWRFGADGAGGPRGAARCATLAVRESAGVIWGFVGPEPEAVAVPDLSPWGAPGVQGFVLDLPMAAHWSLVLDNGLDLFHQHLHRGVAYFFEVHGLEQCAANADATFGEVFTVRYAATLRDVFNRPRRGAITTTLRHNVATLDFDGLPIIHCVVTPLSADGRQVQVWWFVALAMPAWARLGYALLAPRVRAKTMAGFRQDADILAHEQVAWERDQPHRPQLEANPVIAAAHEFLERRIVRSSAALDGGHVAAEQLPRHELLARAWSGRAAVLGPRGGGVGLVAPWELEEQVPEGAQQLLRYGHFYLLNGAAAPRLRALP